MYGPSSITGPTPVADLQLLYEIALWLQISRGGRLAHSLLGLTPSLERPRRWDVPSARSLPWSAHSRKLSSALPADPEQADLRSHRLRLLHDRGSRRRNHGEQVSSAWSRSVTSGTIFVSIGADFLMLCSLAVLTDAAHLLSDVSGFGVALFANYIAAQSSINTHTFGYFTFQIYTQAS